MYSDESVGPYERCVITRFYFEFFACGRSKVETAGVGWDILSGESVLASHMANSSDIPT